MVNYVGLQKLAGKLINNFGGGKLNGKLRRAGVDRTCSVVILQFSNREVAGSTLIDSTDKKVYVDAVGLTVPPDNELDIIVLNDVEHKIVFQPTPLSPDGSVVVYWELCARTLT